MPAALVRPNGAAGHERQLGVPELAIHHVEVGSADRAGVHLEESRASRTMARVAGPDMEGVWASPSRR
jgi:hypothetical protein